MNEQSTPHDYYYGSEAEQYTFYRFPKALFQNDRYKGMSDSAKILYGLMLDRMGLSLKNGWLDKRNRVFIYFTLEDLQEYMNLSVAVIKCKKVAIKKCRFVAEV